MSEPTLIGKSRGHVVQVDAAKCRLFPVTCVKNAEKPTAKNEFFVESFLYTNQTKKIMNDHLLDSSLILYQTEDGQTRVEVRLFDETVWLTQAQMSELFVKDKRTISEHIQNIFKEGELPLEATVRKFRIVQIEGTREVAREIDHYNLDAIISVGYRVSSHRGTQFRIWATSRLKEYLIKGFVLDDNRLKRLRAF